MLFDKAIATVIIFYYLVFHSIVKRRQLTFRANHLAKRILVATLGNFFDGFEHGLLLSATQYIHFMCSCPRLPALPYYSPHRHDCDSA